MDDIFSDQEDEAEKEIDSNIEWKKSGIDKYERLTLRINLKEARQYNAAKSNDLKAKTKPRTPLDVPKGFKKISRKIRDSMDDEEDEDDYILVPVFENMRESPLMRALTEDEKNFLQQNETTNNIRLQENIAKEAIIERAENLVMKAGLGHIDGKALNEGRLKAGKLSVEELVAETVKKKAPSKILTENIKTGKEENKARTTVKKMASNHNEESKKSVRRLNEAETAAKQTATDKSAEKQDDKQKAVTKPQPEKPKPENKKEEVVQTEPSSPKTDEKSTAEQEKAQIDAVREEKQATLKEVEDKINDNQADPSKEELPVKSEPDKEQEEIKNIIMEKSGRTYHMQHLQKPIDKTQLSEPERQKVIEAYIKETQNQGR